MSWDPSQYLKFAGERLRPALDLLARIPAEAPEHVVDLGCGAGNLAPLFLQRWPNAKLLGVDSSAEMLAKARSDHPGASFEKGDVATWHPGQPVDVLYSNATLHWLDGHDTLIPDLLASVRPGGWLAVQMPRNFGAPSHTTIVDTIEQGPWRAKLEPRLRRKPVEEPQFYWRLLQGLTSSLEIWETEYLQALKGDHAVAEFTKGTWLKQFLDRLQEPERSAFEGDYRTRVGRFYKPEADGRTLFPFRRLFIVARRAA
ncbi:MAG TPA: methyltransferase domain-containing protein [Burkholderiales bacterium]|nr:methyltransferase domain-containing protein [Burkholderiales bacterium]